MVGCGVRERRKKIRDSKEEANTNANSNFSHLLKEPAVQYYSRKLKRSVHFCVLKCFMVAECGARDGVSARRGVGKSV